MPAEQTFESTRRFRDRIDAGRKLAVQLRQYEGEQPVVVALPRGGVPVGYEVARALQAPLDICVVRKIGVPWHPELGVGAVAEGGFVYINPGIVRHVGLGQRELSEVTEQKRAEVDERVRKFRGVRPRSERRGRSVLLVDDGIATGGTTRAAILSIRAQKPARIVLAVPVAAAETLRELEPEVEHVVSLLTPDSLYAIGLWYEDFSQVSDAEVVRLLSHAQPQRASHAAH